MNNDLKDVSLELIKKGADIHIDMAYQKGVIETIDAVEKNVDEWWEDIKGGESKDDVNWYTSLKQLFEELREKIE